MVCFLRHRRGLVFTIFAFFYIFISGGTAVYSADLSENARNIPWHISAMSVTFDTKRKLYIAEDNVIITGGKTRLEADYAEFSNKTKDAFAQGHVILISGADSISCNAMKINLATQTGTISRGTIYIQKNNFYINGENIRKTGRFTYRADKGSITSCPGDSPDWKITGDNIKVTIEGYGFARNTVLWAKKLPVIYSPFLVFPVKTKRQTGLLFPQISSSDRKGFEYEQPLFLALSRSTDATLYADYMSDRGTKAAAEYRYVLSQNSKGTVFFDFLDDSKKDDGTSATKNYAFDSTPVRTNTDRFWFRMKHDQELGDGFTARLDIDVASDEDYLQEFRNGFTGYDETKKYFEKQFGRSIDEYDDTTRKNQLNISKSWDNYSFSLNALWYDNISARRQNTEDTTLQTLPGIEFDASRQQLGSTSLFYSFDSEYRSFYRQDTTSTLVKGQRADVHPRVYLPMRLGRYFYFEPYAGARQTVWHTNAFTDINGNSNDFRTREMYDLGASLSTKFIKIFSPDVKFADKIQHEVVPQIEYSFIPNIIQNDLPSFDDLDRIGERNLITWSVTNYFTAKKSFTDAKGKNRAAYNRFAYARLYQTYDIRKKRDGASKPFSDISLDLEFTPNNRILFETDLDWSPYDTHFHKLNSRAELKDSRGDSIQAEYRYTAGSSESLYSRVDIALTDELTSYYSVEKNLMEEKTIETQAGIALKKSCWTLRLFASRSGGEQTIAFLINLHGIGEFGNR